MAYTVANNVKTTLSISVASGATSIEVNAASSPNNNPPNPSDSALLTLMDSDIGPSKIEVVSYTGTTDNGDGTLTLSGVTKGLENTSDQSWNSGDYALQAITKEFITKLTGEIKTVSSTYTMANGEFIHADTSGGVFTVTCPSSPSDGDFIGIRDKASNFATNNLTLDGNGNNILGDTTFVFDVNDQPAEFEYNSNRGEWIFARR